MTGSAFEDEVVSLGPGDKRSVGSGFPREASARVRGRGRRPTLFGINSVFDGERSIDCEIWGTYPKGFVDWALKALGVPASEVLHVCSGALTHRDVAGGTRVDLNPDRAPDVVADGRALPFQDGAFAGVMIDPPYTLEYARDLYGTDYPRPSHLLAEAARVIRGGGRVGILHFLVPLSPPELRFVTCYGVTQGLGYRIRAFTIFERRQGRLV